MARDGPIILVNPNRMKPAVAPLALDYLAQALEEHGFDVALLDLCFAQDVSADIEAALSRLDPILVGVTLRNTDDVYFASQDFIVPRLKEVTDLIKARTEAPIVLGGAGFSVMPEAVLDYCGLDLGVWGEGEQALGWLAERLAAGQEYRDVPGLVFRGDAGFQRNPPRFLDLSQGPSLRRRALDNRRYFDEGGQGSLETKRGCPQRCIYCADPLGKGNALRLRSPIAVADEAEALLEMGVDAIHLCDAEFNIPETHARAVCEELSLRGLGRRMRWYTYAAPTPFSDELATLMQRAGCVGVNFGADSGSDAVLGSLRRGHTAADLAETAAVCHRQGLTFMYDLLLGGPGETKDTLRETVELMKRLSLDCVGASLGVRIFPGTGLAELVMTQGPLEANANLRGSVSGNDNFFAPVFYLSAALGDDPQDYLEELIGGDERFFTASASAADQNYNYNDNSALVEAIRNGHRGAYWDILRRLAKG